MRFPKIPQLMTPEEVVAFVRKLILERWPESDSLDYKYAINSGTQRGRLELAKDISSFANELGGTLIYGVPETEENGVPVPEPLERCGIEIQPGEPERVENFLLDAVRPILPNLFVKPVTLSEIQPKRLLVVNHPASWNKPHMVEFSNERRFFRRGNYRTVRMSEREVEAAYATRRSTQIAAEDFFRTAALGMIPTEGYFLQASIYPRFTLVRREVMREDAFREWLNENPPAGRQGDWVPFLDGVRFLSYAKGALHGRQFELRLFHNGALSFTTEMNDLLFANKLNLATTEDVLKKYLLVPAAKAIELLGIAGPLTLKLSIVGAIGLEAVRKETGGPNWYADPVRGPSPLEKDPTCFVDDFSTDELLGQQEQLLSRVVDRLASAFGMWRTR